jgi:cation diffusion facilitator CzcD-associated flavoprotein CzcO
MPAHIFQVHSRDYRNPGQLPPGAVLVVGSGASGCQIAEELHQAGSRRPLAKAEHVVSALYCSDRRSTLFPPNLI